MTAECTTATVLTPPSMPTPRFTILRMKEVMLWDPATSYSKMNLDNPFHAAFHISQQQTGRLSVWVSLEGVLNQPQHLLFFSHMLRNCLHFDLQQMRHRGKLDGYCDFQIPSMTEQRCYEIQVSRTHYETVVLPEV